MAGSEAGLELIVTSVREGKASIDGVRLRVALHNVADGDVRILQTHLPVPVFFAFDVTKDDGTPVFVPGAGKAAFQEGALDYICLRPREFFGFDLDLADLLEAPLEPGRYRLDVSYHNQYGDDCFIGEIDATTIELTIDG